MYNYIFTLIINTYKYKSMQPRSVFQCRVGLSPSCKDFNPCTTGYGIQCRSFIHILHGFYYPAEPVVLIQCWLGLIHSLLGISICLNDEAKTIW